MKKFLRVMSVVMVFALFIQIMPMSVIAEAVRQPEQAENSLQANPIIGEIVDLREKHSKVFERQDGSKIAVVSAEPIHYKKDGKMTDIDNTMVETKQEGGKVLKNTANALGVELPMSLENNKEIKLESQGYSLAFAFAGSLNSNSAKVIEKEEKRELLKSDSSAEAVEKTKLDEKNTTVKYDNILENIDVEYVIMPESLKENIIVKSKPRTPLVLTYTVKSPGLTAFLNEDNSLDFCAGNDESSVVFHLPAPFMLDTNSKTSYDIKVELIKGDDKSYTLTYKPSMEWLNSMEITYPVIVDPVISLPGSYSTISTAYVNSTSPSTNYVGLKQLMLRKDTRVSLVRLKDLGVVDDDSAVITKANVYLYYDKIPGTTGVSDVSVREITSGGTTWVENLVNWNQYTSMTKGAIVDINTINCADDSKYVGWDITKLVKKWQANNTLSNGMVFEAETALADDIRFRSRTYETVTMRPYYTLEYRSVSGISYGNDNHTQNIGRAGTAYINDFSGALSIARTDMAFSGSRMPVDITWYYNSNLNNFDFGFGKGIRSVYSESLKYTPDSTTDPTSLYPTAFFTLWLGDGGYRYLNVADLPEGHTALEPSETYVVDEQSGEAYVVFQGTDSGHVYFKLTDEAGTICKYYKKSDSLNTTYRYLYKIETLSTETSQSSDIEISIDFATGQINRVTDDAGRKYDFTYTSGLLTKVEYFGTGETALSKVEYTYSSGALSTVKFPDNKQISYEWNQAGDTLNVKNTDNGTLVYAFSTSPSLQVTGVQEIANDETTFGNSISITYEPNQTTYEDNGGNIQVINFDQYGNTISVRDKDGNATFGVYGGESGQGRNLLLGKSDPRRPTVNLLENGGFEYGTLMSEQPFEIEQETGVTIAQFYTGITEQPAYSGARCFKVSCATDTDTFASAELTDLTPGKFYAGSLWIKTVGANAVAQVIGSNYATTYSDLWIDSSKEIKTDGKWQYVQVVIKSSAEGAVVVLVDMKNGGDFYVDNLQIEMGNPANSYNFIEDNDFANSSTYWEDSQSATANQTLEFVGDYAGTSVKLDNNRRKITGVIGAEVYSYQEICLNGKAGETYSFGGWACSIDALPPGDANERSMNIAVVAVSDDSEVEDVELARIDFNTYINNWQFRESSFTLAEDCGNVQIRLIYNNQVNQAYFDGISLQKEGLYKTFDLDGEIVSSSDEPEAEIDVTGSDNSNSLTYDSEYDEYGNITRSSTSNGLYTMSITNTYTANGNYKTSTTDELGNTTQYTYNEQLGLLTGVEDAKENIVSYLYNAMQQNTKVSQTVSNPYYNVTSLAIENNYAYNSSDRLNEISTGNGTEYEFTYDIWGNPVTASVGSTTLATYEYTTDAERKLKKITYANGQSITFERFDEPGFYADAYFLSHIEDNEEIFDFYTIAYLNDFGEVFITSINEESFVRVVDGITEHYVFGTGIIDPPIILHSFGENEIENGTQFLEKIGSTGITSTYTSEGNTTLASVKINEDEAEAVNQVSKTDEFGRVAASGVYQGNSIPLDNAAVVTSYSYDLPGCKTSSRVERMSIAKATDTNLFYKDYLYTYDELGNILTVSEGGILKARYEYDEASQLIRVDDAQQNLSFTYNYDAGGNILNKKEYAYTTGTLGASTDSIDYGYTDTNWKDKMTSYDGSAITYDASGNPTAYNGWQFAWEGGRQLQSMSKTGVGTLAFDYDSNGIRTSKTVNSVVTTFTVVGNKITHQQTGENDIYFFYDFYGQLIGLNYLDETEENPVRKNYFYIKNLQGDIVAITDVDGNIVAEYTYDAWGSLISIKDANDIDRTNDTDFLGYINPFRYRGYYYDGEIGLYYLQSRYYNPAWGRFINADADRYIDGTGLFVYCENNPIILFDESGYSAHQSFSTLISAVLDFALIYSKKCIQNGWEYGTLFYTRTISGKVIYSYYEPWTDRSSAGVNMPLTKNTLGYTLVSMAHTHPFRPCYKGESYSTSDAYSSYSYGFNSYILTPRGNILVLTPATLSNAKYTNYKTDKIYHNKGAMPWYHIRCKWCVDGPATGMGGGCGGSW